MPSTISPASVWRRLRRARPSRFAFADWPSLFAGLPASRHLDAQEQQRLAHLATDFLETKSLTGAAGLVPDDGHRLLVAANACVPILNLGPGWYRDWHQVILYPESFIAEHEFTDQAGVVHRVRRPLSGEAWLRGPVVLSVADLQDTLDGETGNVVIHEMAHKLDMGNGSANGMPPLHRSMDRRRWTDTLSGAYEDYCGGLADERAATGIGQRDDLPFDPYACESPGEFFAVISEDFFMDPGYLHDRLPLVFDQLRLFYRQDPLR